MRQSFTNEGMKKILFFVGSDEVLSGGTFWVRQIVDYLLRAGFDVDCQGFLTPLVDFPNFKSIEGKNYLQGDYDLVFVSQLREFKPAFERWQKKKEKTVVILTEFPEQVRGLGGFDGFLSWPGWDEFGFPLFQIASRIITLTRVTKSFFPVKLQEKTNVLYPVVVRGGPCRRRLPANDYFLVLGRAMRYKRVDLAVKAAASLHRRLFWAGDGFPGDLAKISSLAVSLGVSFNFERRVSEKRKWELLGRAAAVLHFSEHEGFGMVPGEALSVGVPVFARRLPVLEEAYHQFLSYFDNFSEAEQLLKKFSRDPAPFEALAAAGCQFVHSALDQRAFDLRMVGILNSLRST